LADTEPACNGCTSKSRNLGSPRLHTSLSVGMLIWPLVLRVKFRVR